ncbi:MAG: TRAP transporter small permease [Candidatus Eiseniibacteriota bacterium]
MDRDGGLLARLSGLLIGVADLLVVVMTLHICADFALRLVAGASIEGTIEIVSRFYMAAVVLLPLAHVQRARQHIEAGGFARIIPAALKRPVAALADLGMAAIAGLLCWQMASEAATLTANHAQIELATGSLPLWPIAWLAPVALGALALVAAAQLWGLGRAPVAPAPTAG